MLGHSQAGLLRLTSQRGRLELKRKSYGQGLQDFPLVTGEAVASTPPGVSGTCLLGCFYRVAGRKGDTLCGQLQCTRVSPIFTTTGGGPGTCLKWQS